MCASHGGAIEERTCGEFSRRVIDPDVTVMEANKAHVLYWVVGNGELPKVISDQGELPPPLSQERRGLRLAKHNQDLGGKYLDSIFVWPFSCQASELLISAVLKCRDKICCISHCIPATKVDLFQKHDPDWVET